MLMKIWSIKNPLLGGVLLASALSQTAAATELPPSQPLPTLGIPTPDQAVRRMATNEVFDSRASTGSFISGQPNSTGIGADRLTPRRPVSPLPLTAGLPNPSQVLSSCPNNVCGLVATQPPVTLGTALPSGISKTEQNKLTNFINSTTSTPQKVDKVDPVAPQTITPSDQITNAARISLSTEPGLSKDVAFSQPAANSAKTEKTENKTEVQPAASLSTQSSKVATLNTPNQAIGFGNVQTQISSFTGQLVANSWKLITVLPKPQLDSSLLNIGSSRLFQQTDLLSFSPRLTLGNAIELVTPNPVVISSLKASPLFSAQEPVAKTSPMLIQWNQSSFFAKPLYSSKPNKFSVYGFSNLNQFETSIKPFNIVNFLATVNTSRLLSNNLGS